MTDREAIKAIEVVQDSDYHYDETIGYQLTSYDFDWLEKAKQALQEREKRSKGCEVCDQNPKAVWYRFKDKNVLCSFCPVCGKNIKGMYSQKGTPYNEGPHRCRASIKGTLQLLLQYHFKSSSVIFIWQ